MNLSLSLSLLIWPGSLLIGRADVWVSPKLDTVNGGASRKGQCLAWEIEMAAKTETEREGLLVDP